MNSVPWQAVSISIGHNSWAVRSEVRAIFRSLLPGLVRNGPELLVLLAVLFCFSERLSSQSAENGIVVDVEGILVSSPIEAYSVIDRLKKGEDFATLAKQLSIDSSAPNGGRLGGVSLAALRPELRDAVAQLNPGQISQPIKTPLGYYVVEVLTRSRPSSPVTMGGGTDATNSVGSVKYVLAVDGLSEAELPLVHIAQQPGWNPVPQAVCSVRRTLVYRDGLAKHLSPENKAELDAMPPLDLLHEYYTLGELYAFEGSMDRAIAEYKQAMQVATSRVSEAETQLNEALGIAYLHKSEMENDVYRKPGDKCVLPMRPANKYKQPGDSKIAVEYFLKYLAAKPDELEVKWLLNLAYMSLGEYPESVPKKYLIPPSTFQSGANMPRFRDVAPEAGLDTFSMAGGVIADDFQNNGRIDIVKSSMDPCAPLEYFRNNGDGTFTEQASKIGLGDVLGGLNLVQTDYNNDGCTDILVMRGGWEVPQYRSLLRNNCDGTFTDVTEASGIAKTPSSSQTTVWADINNDGFLDLFVGNENGGAAQLFLNKGDGTFEDISHSAGIDRISFAKGVAAADYDNDGYPDLFVSNLNGPHFLYHNNRDATFTEVGASAGVNTPTRGFATWFFDYDNDGWPDLFVTSYFFSVEESARTYMGLPHNGVTLRLYRNLHNGTFRDVTKELGLDKVFMPMGANFGDIDNDGFLDIYLGTGNPSYGSLIPNVLLRNNVGKSFVDVTTATGTGDWHKGHGVAFADLGNRGFEDIVAEIGGATPGDKHAMRVFENSGNANDWITLKLIGVRTNRAAIGARIRVTVDNEGQGTRSIYRTVGSGGSFGASPLQQHIGLGKKANIQEIEVWWPASNTRQHFTNVGKNQFLQITEFSQQYAKLERNPFKLGHPAHTFAAKHVNRRSASSN